MDGQSSDYTSPNGQYWLVLAKTDLDKIQNLTIEHPNVQWYHYALIVLYYDYSDGEINLHMG